METIVQQNEISTLIQESGVEKTTAESLKEAFTPFFDQAQEWAEKAKGLVVTSVDQVEEMKQAREARLILKNIRIEADKTRKRMKEDSLRYGRAVQGVYNIIEYMVKPTEEYLQEQEDFVKIQEQKRKEQLKEDRLKALEPYAVDTQFVRLDEMTEEVWETYLNQVKAAHQAKIDAEQKAEQERLEQEKKDRIGRERENMIAPLLSFYGSDNERPDVRNMSTGRFVSLIKELQDRKKEHAAEQERIRKENERLKAEAEAEKKRLAEIEEKRKAKEEQERKEREERERKEKEAHAAALKKEREERAKLEAEMKAKKEAEENARKEREAAERKAQLAPDKEKLSALAEKFACIALPEMSHPEAGDLLKNIKNLQDKLVKYVREQSMNL